MFTISEQAASMISLKCVCRRAWRLFLGRPRTHASRAEFEAEGRELAARRRRARAAIDAELRDYRAIMAIIDRDEAHG